MFRLITKMSAARLSRRIIICVCLCGAAALVARADVGSVYNVEGRWAGARVSDAYAYAECPNCAFRNEIRAERCRRCGTPLPQPSPEMADPSYVFVPGRGYFREGSLVEPGKTQKGYWVTGVVLMAAGTATAIASYIAMDGYSEDWFYVAGLPSFAGMTVGGVLFVVGFTTRAGPVYASAGDGFPEARGRRAFALRSAEAEGAAFRVEVTALSF